MSSLEYGNFVWGGNKLVATYEKYLTWFLRSHLQKNHYYLSKSLDCGEGKNIYSSINFLQDGVYNTSLALFHLPHLC